MVEAVLSQEGPKISVTGVASLHNRIFVAFHKSNKIDVHRADGPVFLKLHEIPVKELRGPWDLAACKMRRCLYVTDSATNRLWRLAVPELELAEDPSCDDLPSFSEGNRTVGKTSLESAVRSLQLVKEESQPKKITISRTDVQTMTTLTAKMMKLLDGISAPHTVCVISDGRLLLAKSRPPSCLEIYNPSQSTGKLQPLQSLLLPTDIADPQYAIETTVGTFFVSHGDDRISEVSFSSDGHTPGTLVRTSDIRLNLAMPKHLVLDEDGGVIVADCTNGRVLHLDQRLVLKRVILNEKDDQLLKPHRLSYDHHTGRLIVAQKNGIANVKIVSLK